MPSQMETLPKTEPQKTELEKSEIRPEEVKKVLSLMPPSNSTIDLQNIIWGKMDGTLSKTTTEEIYRALQTRGQWMKNPKAFLIENGKKPKALVVDSTFDINRKRLLNNLLTAASMSKDCELFLAEFPKTQETKTEADELFDSLVNFVKTNSALINTKYTESQTTYGSALEDSFYKNFYNKSNIQLVSQEEEKKYGKSIAQAYIEIKKNPDISLFIKDGWVCTGFNFKELPDDQTGRLYFNIKTEQAPELFLELHKQIVDLGITKHYGIKTSFEFEKRLDGCVLYFSALDQNKILELIKKISQNRTLTFVDELGAGQSKLYPGIGFAQEPTKEIPGPNKFIFDRKSSSFGEKLCWMIGKLVTYTIQVGWAWDKDIEKIKTYFKQICEFNNVDPANPAFHLNDNNFAEIRKFTDAQK